MGWSTADCNSYRWSLSTVWGTLKPFLRDGNVPNHAKLYALIIELVKMVLSFLPTEHIFQKEDYYTEKRTKMVKEFHRLIGGSRSIEKFSC